jgi:epoxyqueuosine reductase
MAVESIVLKRDISAYARSLGFGRVGVMKAEPFHREEAALGVWLEKGRAGSMDYMEKNWKRRARPEELLPGVRSVIALAMSYYNGERPEIGEGEGRVARYAWGKDYHKLIEKRLDSLVRYMEAFAPEVRCKTLVDTGPLLERAAAQKAGLGFVGKNTMLITRGLGSYVFLASVLTTLELPADAADERNCGTCTLCIDACPTQAITEPYQLDARRCISYLTIETSDEVPAGLRNQMGNWVFGCDICQEVCPHNTRIPITPIAEFLPQAGIGPTLNLAQIQGLKTDQEFNTFFSGTPLKRAKRHGLQRNARRLDENKNASIL